MIKYKEYSLEKVDDRNWQLSKEVDRVSKSTVRNKEGVIVLTKGEEYKGSVSLGFYGNVGIALGAVVNDKAGEGCQSIEDVIEQLDEMKRDLSSLLNL